MTKTTKDLNCELEPNTTEISDVGGELEANEGFQQVLQLIEEKNQQVEEWSQRCKYLQADFENFRRRSRVEKEELSQVITQSVAVKLLPIIDNFERALAVSPDQSAASILEGVELIYRQFMSTLESFDIRPIDAIGANFDPNLHEAVARIIDADKPDGVILEEFQRGYILGTKAIRPSMVKVATNS